MQLHNVQSSNVESVGHEGTTLHVRYKGSSHTYAHEGVSKEDFEKLMASESIGKHLNQHIKPKFPAHKLSAVAQ